MTLKKIIFALVSICLFFSCTNKYSKEELENTLGIRFNLPENISKEKFNIEEDNTISAKFMWNKSKCELRVQVSDELNLVDISNISCDWDKTESVKISYNDAQVKISSKDKTSICIWWDQITGLQYSVSMKNNSDLERIVELANILYFQHQGEESGEEVLEENINLNEIFDNNNSISEEDFEEFEKLLQLEEAEENN